MTIETTVGDNGTSQDILSAAERHFSRILDEVEDVIATLKGGDAKASSEARSITRNLNQAVQTVFAEREKVEKLRKQKDGIVHDYALDFDAARAEIGRRLACLRDAQGAAEFSG